MRCPIGLVCRPTDHDDAAERSPRAPPVCCWGRERWQAPFCARIVLLATVNKSCRITCEQMRFAPPPWERVAVRQPGDFVRLRNTQNRPLAQPRHGHCPLLTHRGAGEALRTGAANDVAAVSDGTAAVAVEPTLMAVGLSDIAGTVGCTCVPVTDESPDPPARLLNCASRLSTTLTANASAIAAPPTSAYSLLLSVCISISNKVIRCGRVAVED
jgi:hypothetical protein